MYGNLSLAHSVVYLFVTLTWRHGGAWTDVAAVAALSACLVWSVCLLAAKGRGMPRRVLWSLLLCAALDVAFLACKL